MNEFFRRFSHQVAQMTGSSGAFIAAGSVILLWLLTGPIFGFSDTWQLVINTGTTIVTFLMVFLIQNAQNRDAKALHLKLDELIRAVKEARNQLIDLEEGTDAEIEALDHEFKALHQTSRDAP
jgi:low affinity Fe/Cu permease